MVISVEVLSSFNHVVSSTLEKLKLTYTLAMYKINEKSKEKVLSKSSSFAFVS